MLETRWSAAKVTFDEAELDVVGVEFTDGDAAKTKTIVTDYIQRDGNIDGVWMDAGATAVAASRRSRTPASRPADHRRGPARLPEEVEGRSLTAIAPTYPTYQWRTPVIAALKILKGEEVPKEWMLPQPTITAGHPGRLRRPEHAAAALRDLRLRGPARLPGRLGR